MTDLVERREVASGRDIARMLRRIASEVVERAGGVDGVALVGIRTGGYDVAKRLKVLIDELEGADIPLGAVDITLYRDDVFKGLPKPEVGTTELPFRLAGYTVVLVDDVLYTGRTVRAALDGLMDYGRPTGVRLAVLVDRGHRELPIQADFVGKVVDTAADESVKVELGQGELEDRVVVRGAVR